MSSLRVIKEVKLSSRLQGRDREVYLLLQAFPELHPVAVSTKRREKTRFLLNRGRAAVETFFVDGMSALFILGRSLTQVTRQTSRLMRLFF